MISAFEIIEDFRLWNQFYIIILIPHLEISFWASIGQVSYYIDFRVFEINFMGYFYVDFRFSESFFIDELLYWFPHFRNQLFSWNHIIIIVVWFPPFEIAASPFMILAFL